MRFESGWIERTSHPMGRLLRGDVIHVDRCIDIDRSLSARLHEPAGKPRMSLDRTNQRAWVPCTLLEQVTVYGSRSATICFPMPRWPLRS